MYWNITVHNHAAQCGIRARARLYPAEDCSKAEHLVDNQGAVRAPTA